MPDHAAQWEPAEIAQRRPQLGLLLPMTGSGQSIRQLLGEIEAEVKAAEESGFSVALVPEHHHGPAAGLSDSLSVTTWLLARTGTIHVGPGVMIAPLHDAVTVAERASILQHASGGRLVLGVGAGYQPADFAIFGKDVAKRKEAFGAFLGAWQEILRGEHRVMPALPAVPPPLWVGAWSGAGIRSAACYADRLLVDPIRSDSEIQTIVGAYRRACAITRRPVRTAVIRHLWVAGDDQTARREFGPVIEPIYRYYHRHGGLGAAPELTSDDLTLEAGLRDRVICGSARSVIDRINAIVALTGATIVIASLRQPAGPAHQAVINAIRLLAREVMPNLAPCPEEATDKGGDQSA